MFSGEILGKLNDEVGKIEEIQSQLDYCIYVTGSYARKEASKFSDLDLFFINKFAQFETNCIGSHINGSKSNSHQIPLRSSKISST